MDKELRRVERQKLAKEKQSTVIWQASEGKYIKKE